MERERLTDEQLSDFLSRACVQLNPELTQSLIQIVRELIAIRELNEKYETLTDLQEANVNSMFETTMELRKEIEQLTRESDEMFDRHVKENQAASILIEKRNNEIAELQKQVDELKKWLDMKEHYIAISKDKEQQAVKDTAKEIYDFAKGFFTWDEEGFVRELKELVQDYGVEVE